MSRELDLGLDKREGIGLDNLTKKLSHKKECATNTTRVFNKRSKEIELANELINTGRLKAEKPYRIIRDLDTLDEYIKEIQYRKAYVLDMETTGLDIFNDIIVGVCIYVEGLESAYIPINHTDINNNRVPNQLDEEVVKEKLRPIFEDENIKTFFHNAKYDYKVILWNWGIRIANIFWDTLIGAFLLNENEKHGLKPLYNKYVLKGQGSGEDFGDYFGSTPFNYIPIEVAGIYGANDGVKTWELYLFQRQFLTRTSNREDFVRMLWVMRNIELPLIPILADIELKGVAIREDFAKELGEEMRAELNEVLSEMDKELEGIKDDILANETLNRLTGGTGKINYSSPQQLQCLFYDVLELKSGDRKNPRGTGEDILKKLIDKYDVLFIKKLLKYRELNKLLTTYVEKIPNILEPKTNAVHSDFNQLGAKTGRFSSSHPITKLNLQNIPSKEKRIRKIFCAREGNLFIGGDFSQIEPRTLASLSGDEKMREAYANNKDLYSMMASEVYGVPVEDCMEFRPDGTVNPEGKERRTSMKSVLLGIMYCRGANSIGEQLGKSTKWAEELIANFNKSFPKIAEYSQKVIYQAEKLGYVNTLFGRKRRLPDMKLPRDSWEYKEAYRQCLNAVIQGTAGDIMKLALINVATNPRMKELGVEIRMTIHDEMICEVPEENAREGAKLMEDIMKDTCFKALNIPAKVDCEATHYWYGENVL